MSGPQAEIEVISLLDDFPARSTGGDNRPSSPRVVDAVLQAEFEREKAQILADIPEEAKARFGMICLADMPQKSMPGLVLSPYMAPPGSGRDLWRDMYVEAKAANRLSQMSNLVYWYGSPNFPSFTMVPTEKLIKIEEEVPQGEGFDRLQMALQKNAISGKLGDGIEWTIALEEMCADLDKKKCQRRGFIPDFREFHELDGNESDECDMDQDLMDYAGAEEFQKPLEVLPTNLKRKLEEAMNDEFSSPKKRAAKNNRAKVTPLPRAVGPKPHMTTPVDENSSTLDSLKHLIDEWESSLDSENKAGLDDILGQVSTRVEDLMAEVRRLPKLLQNTKCSNLNQFRILEKLQTRCQAFVSKKTSKKPDPL